MEKIERICILNFIFKIIGTAGVVSIVLLALMSDSGNADLSKLFVEVSLSFLASTLGIWGAVNCSKIIESYKESIRRQKLRIKVSNSANAA